MPKLAEFLLDFQGPTSYLLVFLILLACGFGVPIPEDVTLIAAGILSYYQAADVHVMIVVSLVGVMLGDGAMFGLGRRYGLALTRKPFLARTMTPERIQSVQDILHRRGNKILFAARFMPGLRAPLFFTAGALGVPARLFILYDGLAALISVPAIVYSVYAFGHEMEDVIAMIQRANHGILLAIVLVVVGITVKVRLDKRRERRAAVLAASVDKIDAA